VKDELYTIALANAEKYDSLARRAEKSDDQELADFFRRMRDHSRANADRAKVLLAQRLAE
jgi:rubrerythrin